MPEADLLGNACLRDEPGRLLVAGQYMPARWRTSDAIQLTRRVSEGPAGEWSPSLTLRASCSAGLFCQHAAGGDDLLERAGAPPVVNSPQRQVRCGRMGQ